MKSRSAQLSLTIVCFFLGLLLVAQFRTRQMTDSSLLSTTTGRIEVSLPDTSEFYLNARTNVGRIDCDFDSRHLQDTRRGLSHQLEGPVGDDPEVELTVSSKTGAISIVESR